MKDLNFFRHIEVIEAGSAQLLASKLKSITFAFQLANVWSDGKKHYAMINSQAKINKATLDKINSIKE